MSSKPKIVTEIEELKEDASRVLANIVKISSHIRDSGADTASELAGEVPEQLKEKINNIRATITEMKEDISQSAEKADKHVKTNPYLYLALAGGIGFALGKLQAPRRES